MSDIWKSPCGRMELRLGRWQDVLADVTECDAVITDPPYSERTIAGQRSGTITRVGGTPAGKGTVTNALRYSGTTRQDATDLVQHFAPMTKRWGVFWCDHIQARWIEEALQQLGWMTFAPVPWVKSDGGCPRFSADGPAAAVEWSIIARPKRRAETRYRPGFYLCQPNKGQSAGHVMAGAKPLPLMVEVVKDYSEPGDLIVEPFAGTGTTLLAAAIEGRCAIGAECDPETYAKAVKRLSAGYTPAMTFDRKPKQKQEGLF